MISIQRGLPFGLLAVAVLLCVIISQEILGGRQGPAVQPAARIATPSHGGSTDVSEPPDRHEAWLNQILARPLFSPDRRPVEVGVRGLPRLTGIVMAGSQRLAIFAAPSNGHPIVAQTGAHVGAYEVRTIADGIVTLVGPQGTTSIRPIFDVARPQATASPLARPQPVRPAAR